MLRGVYVRTAEHRRKQSEIMKIIMNRPEIKVKLSESHKGKHPSEETKKKISEALKGEFIDLVEQKFGRLTVIKRADNNKWGVTMWLCRCICGTEKIIIGDSLKGGFTKSCGCLRRELIGDRKRLSPGLSNMRILIGWYKAGAKERGLDFKLTEKQFKKLTQQDCHYCETKPNNIVKGGGCIGEYIYNGIDRVDNKKGYVIGNVVPCCKRCNQAKRNLTLQEYQDWIKRSYNKMFG